MNIERRNKPDKEKSLPHGFPQVLIRLIPTDISRITATVTRYEDDRGNLLLILVGPSVSQVIDKTMEQGVS